MDCSLPGSSVHGILQTRILEWVAFCFSSGSSQSRDQTHVSCTTGWFFAFWATREALFHSSVYVSIPISHFIPPPFLSPWQPYSCFPHLWLYFCFVNRFICTIFLDVTYKQYHMNLSFSDLFSSVWLSLDPSKSLQMGLFHSFFNFRSKNVLKIRYRNDLESFVLP